ncbi:hypothetical protein IFR04_004692 [Cadophora malorum]|uniref:Uncharacterized protein n=1 Tax=Cadophora malorum TaxID=108018 RepID=A0A8H7WC98_9HELO|nr:hypothetical protein IFR04_004692 [Cadophora malorum]
MTNVSLNLPRIDPESDDKDPTKDLRLEIGSLLSLWLRTINKRSSIPEWKLDSPSALRRNEMMEIEMRVGPKNVFLRVVATEQTGDREEYRKLYLLGQWLEGPLFRVPCPVGMAPLSRSGGAFGFDTQQSSSLEHLLHQHPVFGLAFSSLLSRDIEDSYRSEIPFTDVEILSIERAGNEKGIFPWSARQDYNQHYGGFDSFFDSTLNIKVESTTGFAINSVDEQWRKHAEQIAYLVSSEDAPISK